MPPHKIPEYYMPCNCLHLLTVNTKVVKAASNSNVTTYHCRLKRESKEITKEINQAYQRKTQVSVAGYSCYYCDHKDLVGSDCPKFEEKK